MAADILLYQTDLVPVGSDQKQHLEITRDIAMRFNGVYGNVFKIPEGFTPKAGARIMSLQEPTSKMSKSDPNENGFISILDTPDADNLIKVREGHDGINNLINIYSAITKKEISDIEAEFDGKGYGDFKQSVAEAAVEELRPIRERYNALIKDKAYIEEIYKKGALAAQKLASRTLSKVHRKLGFVDRKF